MHVSRPNHGTDRSLPQPYEDQLNAYLNEPAFKALANGLVYNVARKIQKAGMATTNVWLVGIGLVALGIFLTAGMRKWRRR